jgi:hypothetical protein
MVVLDATAVDRITAEARTRAPRPGRTLLALLAGLLYLVGYVPATVCSAVGFAAAWSAAAVRLGWREARARPGGESR